MRRLPTGYAVTFNLRHSRSGHLYLAARELGWKGTVVGRMLGLTPAGVSLAVRRGFGLMETKPELRRHLGMET
jgi:hypothetical protein